MSLKRWLCVLLIAIISGPLFLGSTRPLWAQRDALYVLQPELLVNQIDQATGLEYVPFDYPGTSPRPGTLLVQDRSGLLAYDPERGAIQRFLGLPAQALSLGMSSAQLFVQHGADLLRVSGSASQMLQRGLGAEALVTLATPGGEVLLASTGGQLKAIYPAAGTRLSLEMSVKDPLPALASLAFVPDPSGKTLGRVWAAVPQQNRLLSLEVIWEDGRLRIRPATQVQGLEAPRVVRYSPERDQIWVLESSGRLSIRDGEGRQQAAWLLPKGNWQGLALAEVAGAVEGVYLLQKPQGQVWWVGAERLSPTPSSSTQTATTTPRPTAVAAAAVTAAADPLPPTPAPDIKINFQPDTSPVPAGFSKDIGAAYDPSRGFGWVREDSPATPLDLVANTRDRNRPGIDAAHNTLIHLQYPPQGSKTDAVKTPAVWEYNLPNGIYTVTVSVGDQGAYDSQHTIRLEGKPILERFQPTAALPYKQATAEIAVNDGKLTVDAIGGTNTKLDYLTITTSAAGAVQRPKVSTSVPTDGTAGVCRDSAVKADLDLPNPGGIDAATINTNTVSLMRTQSNTPVPGVANTSGAGDSIVYQPSALLEPNTEYTLTVTSGVKDVSGAAFLPYTVNFATGTATCVKTDGKVNFTKSTVYSGSALSSLLIGPDGKLYAASLDGNLHRWTINNDGSLSNLETLGVLAGRTVIGLAFDPTNPKVLWVSHNDLVTRVPAEDFSGGVCKLTLGQTGFTATVQPYIVGLPRSGRDHMSNSLAFGPDGLLYLSQGSNSAMGFPDRNWYNRAERLLNATVLQIDPRRTTGLPVAVQTEDYTTQAGAATKGGYNPYRNDAILKIYATGIRNAYDLLWHSNGRLYLPTNGSAAGGNTPASPPGITPQIPNFTSGPTQHDYLFMAEQGGFYGHPNPKRDQYVLNGGNPTSGVDPAEVVATGQYQGYPVGVKPDSNYRFFAFDFGRNQSPNGVIEYKSDTFGGALKGKILVVEYSAGDDILALTPGPDGKIPRGGATQVMGGFDDPLDLTEDPRNGDLYVIELIDKGMGGSRIALLRPAATPAQALSRRGAIAPMVDPHPLRLPRPFLDEGDTARAVQSVGVQPNVSVQPADEPLPGSGRIELENLDGVPFPDRLVFNRIERPSSNKVHDKATLRVKNTGSGPLAITELLISTRDWVLDKNIDLPLTIPAGKQADIPIRYRATGGGVSRGTLTLKSDATATPSVTVQLAGFWQQVSEEGEEPSVVEIMRVLGYGTLLRNEGQSLTNGGLVQKVGEEVLSPYWKQVVSSQPVTVRQLAAYHSRSFRAAISWYSKGSSSLQAIFTQAAQDFQSLLPHKNDSASSPAYGSFNPRGSFGFNIAGEWSDPTKNGQGFDRDNGCPGPCGHHVRVWPARGEDGAILPNTYLMVMDYYGANDDYNDNLYLITNVQPDNPRVNPNTPGLYPGIPTLSLDFDRSYPDTLTDKNDQGIGFTETQPNNYSRQSPARSQLALDPSGAGTLQITTSPGSNIGGSNDLVNGLQMSFDGRASRFILQARLLGPLSPFIKPAQQAGIMFGPDQDNYLKFVVQADKTLGPVLRFTAEQNAEVSAVGADIPIADPATVQSLDLKFMGDPRTGTIQAAYRLVSAQGDTGLITLPASVTIPPSAWGRFFSNRSEGGILASSKSAQPLTVTYDNFAILPVETSVDPAAAARTVLYRLNAAGAGFTDSQGNVWSPDTGYYSPSDAINEGGANPPPTITNTADPTLYRTYRGNVGSGTPQNQRVLTYTLPVGGANKVDLRLHFAELNWGVSGKGSPGPGKRVFDISVNGKKVLDGFDITAASGEALTAVMVPIQGIPVTDGVLTLELKADIDFPAIAGLEVLQSLE
ncbi:malectin domain-containing carbohydrate-binding protein [Anthocerotibacter panamensis]|uniref:malectin domain-containing carbohydrate-binding protein n=1 Tax=Anthocerotibacter panamensis TaxID=2857077 RepID=UPI001C405375|nr:malectin domain-containing carbohydrate-binding protein [Anthocerotibacter panamensis]